MQRKHADRLGEAIKLRAAAWKVGAKTEKIYKMK